MSLELLWVILAGLILGSFLNVVIYRLPRGESLLGPFSKCPSCGKTIKWYHNIPIISYIILKGRCAECSAKISLRYPLVELLTLLILVALYFKIKIPYGLSAFLFLSYFTLALISLSFIDLAHKEIPDVLSIPLLFAGWIFTLLGTNPFIAHFLDSLLSGFAGIGLLFFINELYYLATKRDGLGMGDFKLMGGIGAFLGYQSFFNVLFFASLLGLVTFLGYLGYQKIFLKESQEREILKREIPFGPFLSLAALLYLFYPQSLL